MAIPDITGCCGGRLGAAHPLVPALPPETRARSGKFGHGDPTQFYLTLDTSYPDQLHKHCQKYFYFKKAMHYYEICGYFDLYVGYQ